MSALVLTTGTTGQPKGVRHEWARLVASSGRPDERPGNRWLLAYDPNQFAGLQVILHVLRSRATLVVPPSRGPVDAVRTIEQHGVTHVSATPTFWRLLTGVIDEARARDLPLLQITMGGEAVPEALLVRLAELFPAARITQIYAATEFGVGTSVGDRSSGLPISVLDRPDDADVRLRIVDGELQVRSRNGMLGYYGGAEANVDEWWPTGDLVEVRDGRIVFVGRVSDTINVGGVKVHPLPVEELAAGVDGVTLARAYGHPNAVTGQIVALDVVARSGFDREAVASAVREACHALAPAARPRRIRVVDEIDVRSQKIVRSAGAR